MFDSIVLGFAVELTLTLSDYIEFDQFQLDFIEFSQFQLDSLVGLVDQFEVIHSVSVSKMVSLVW